MDEDTLKAIVDELTELLPGRFLGRILQLSTLSLVIDFGLKDKGYLFIGIEPAAPRLHLMKRTSRELEKASIPLAMFAQTMRTNLGSGCLVSVAKDGNDRVVRFSFSVADDLGDSQRYSLIAQLTGRSANLFLLDADGNITQAWRNPQGEGQQPGEPYRPPAPPPKSAVAAKLDASSGVALVHHETGGSASADADEYYQNIETEHQFNNLAGNLVAKLGKELSKRKKLRSNLAEDLLAHGNPEEHKRLGDLLLANIANAKRAGDRVTLTDYYSEGQPDLELTIDENKSLQDAAAGAFSRYGKAKRAVGEIKERLTLVEQELAELKHKQTNLDEAIASRDESILLTLAEGKMLSSRLAIASSRFVCLCFSSASSCSTSVSRSLISPTARFALP